MRIFKDKNENSWGAGCHLAAFAGVVVPLGNILGPLIVWILKKETSDFIDSQGKEALNFQISFMLYEMVLWAFLALTIFPSIFMGPGMRFGMGTAFMGMMPMIGLAGIIMLIKIVLVVIASVSAAQGQQFRYPFTIRFIK